MGVLTVLKFNIELLKIAAVCAVPIYVTVSSAIYIKKHIEKYREDCMWQQKHNCVVMYSKGYGMTGWPPYDGRVILNINNFSKYFEPIVFFIDTAKTTLDIAIMNINIKPIIDALEAALIRGVAVRLILDYQFMKNDKSVYNLQQLGAQISYYVHYDIDTLMHYKYALKDFDGESGYVLCGSMNWTVCSAVENFEDLVFTTNKKMVKAISHNYQEAWKFLEKQKEMNEDNENL